MTVGLVIDGYARELPGARIYVYDNNSTDATHEVARAHGATVYFEPRRGKGNVVRQAFRDIEADYYILVDGDDAFEPESVHELLGHAKNGYDLVVGDRISSLSYGQVNSRKWHGFGNRLVCSLVSLLYGVKVHDVLSGYRVVNHSFAKAFPILSKGFEIETEMSIHAIDKNLRVKEVPVVVKARPEGSTSKLSTYRDGARVLSTIFSLFKDCRPLVFFSIIAAILTLIGLLLGIGVIIEFFETSRVDRFPTAILSVALIIIGMLALSCGLILDTVVKGSRKEYELSVLRLDTQRNTQENIEEKKHV